MVMPLRGVSESKPLPRHRTCSVRWRYIASVRILGAGTPALPSIWRLTGGSTPPPTQRLTRWRCRSCWQAWLTGALMWLWLSASQTASLLAGALPPSCSSTHTPWQLGARGPERSQCDCASEGHNRRSEAGCGLQHMTTHQSVLILKRVCAHACSIDFQ